MARPTDKTKSIRNGTSKSKRGGKRSSVSHGNLEDAFSASSPFHGSFSQCTDEQSLNSSSSNKLNFAAPFSTPALPMPNKTHFVGASDDDMSADEEEFRMRQSRRDSVQSADFLDDLAFDQFQQQYHDNARTSGGDDENLEESFSWKKPGSLGGNDMDENLEDSMGSFRLSAEDSTSPSKRSGRKKSPQTPLTLHVKSTSAIPSTPSSSDTSSRGSSKQHLKSSLRPSKNHSTKSPISVTEQEEFDPFNSTEGKSATDQRLEKTQMVSTQVENSNHGEPTTPSKVLDIDTNTPLGVAGTCVMATPSSSGRGRASSRARSRARAGSRARGASRSRSRVRGKSKSNLENSSSSLFESSFSAGLNIEEEDDFDFNGESFKDSTSGSTRKDRTTGEDMPTSTSGTSSSANHISSPSRSGSGRNVTRIRIKTNGRKIDGKTARRLIAEKMQKFKGESGNTPEAFSESMNDLLGAADGDPMSWHDSSRSFSRGSLESAVIHEHTLFSEDPVSPSKSLASTKSSTKGSFDPSIVSESTNPSSKKSKKSSKSAHDSSKSEKEKRDDKGTSDGTSTHLRKKQNPFLERFLGAASGNVGTVFDDEQKKAELQNVNEDELEAAVRAAMISKANGGDGSPSDDNNVLSNIVHKVLQVSSSLQQDEANKSRPMGEVAINKDFADAISVLGNDDILNQVADRQMRFQKAKEFATSRQSRSATIDEKSERRSRSKLPKKKSKETGSDSSEKKTRTGRSKSPEKKSRSGRSKSPTKKSRSGRSESPTKKSRRDRSVSPQKRSKEKQVDASPSIKKDKRSKSRGRVSAS